MITSKINNTNIYADELQEIEKKMSEDASNLDDPTRVLNDSTVATTCPALQVIFLSFF